MDEERVVKLREAFLQWAGRQDPQRLWFVDEAGSHIAMTPLYGRAPRGERLCEAVPRNRGTVTTLFAALTTAGMVGLMTILGGTTGEVFLAYLREILLPLMKPGDTLVIDNLAAHRMLAVAELVEEAGCHLKFLPPYSPDLMPIELGWSKAKQQIRKLKPRSQEELDAAFVTAAQRITPQDASGWLHHTGFQAQPL